MIQRDENLSSTGENASHVGIPPTVELMPENLIQIIWRSRWIVLLTTVAALAAGFLYKGIRYQRSSAHRPQHRPPSSGKWLPLPGLTLRRGPRHSPRGSTEQPGRRRVCARGRRASGDEDRLGAFGRMEVSRVGRVFQNRRARELSSIPGGSPVGAG